MLLTEDDARTKWCPYYQVVAATGDLDIFEIDNRPPQSKQVAPGRWEETGELHKSCTCIASNCMAWRLSKRRGSGPIKEQTIPAGKAGMLEVVPGHEWFSGGKSEGDVTWGLFPILGFCGLAGGYRDDV